MAISFVLLLLFVLKGRLLTYKFTFTKKLKNLGKKIVRKKEDFVFQELMVLASLAAEKLPHTRAPTWLCCKSAVDSTVVDPW